MDFILILGCLAVVVGIYYKSNPLNHTRKFMNRRFVNWLPLGMSYAFLYMARYNLSVSKNALGVLMSKEDFGVIFGVGTLVYGLSFLVNGPLVDNKFGGKRGMIIALLGSCIANVMMGLVTVLYLKGTLKVNLVLAFSILYSVNMYFQSYGAISIIKVKAYWFHVRERGVFGAIFGTLISFGIYFAFDWGQAIADASTLHSKGPLNGFQTFLRTLFAVDAGTTDAFWMIFFIPAFMLIVWALIDLVLLKDTPKLANFADFDTHDASSGEMERTFTTKELLHKVFSSPVLRMVAIIDFSSGIIRNGILQWYFIFAKEVPQTGAEFFKDHWGILVCFAGIFGGFLAGGLSDYYFHSRRGPPSVIMNVIMLICTSVMALILMTSPVGVGTCALIISLAVIGVHSSMSGTAAADFGGRKATATASGIVDGCVYLGSGIQSISLGFLTSKDWHYWPVFLISATLLGLFFSIKMWKDLPAATRKYLDTHEKSKPKKHARA